MNSVSRALMMASSREGERLAREARIAGNHEEANRILGLINDPKMEEQKNYCCPRLKECNLVRENPMEIQYRCHDRQLASICVGQNDRYNQNENRGKK